MAEDGPNTSRPGVFAPALVLGLYAAFAPVPQGPQASSDSAEQCLAQVDTGSNDPRGDRTLLERCSAIYPTDVDLLADLGASYEAVEPARAEATFRRALDLDPDYAELRLRLGRLLLRRGAAADAVREAEAALRVQPNRRVLVDFLAAARSAAAEASR